MKKYLSFLLLPAALLLGAGQASFAATATSQFNVIINVQPSCDFQASTIPDLDFGTAASGAAVTNKTTTFTIQCTIGTAPKITLGSANSWKMIGVDTTPYDNTSADPIPYTLYSNAALTSLWDESDSSSPTVAGDGTAQAFTVYGQVADAGATVGNFKDVVTVTLTY